MSPPLSFPQTMTPPTDRFIELATRPLCDNAEMKLAAEMELRRRIDPCQNRAIDDAIQALQYAESHPSRKWWLRLLLMITALASVISLIQVAALIRNLGLAWPASPLKTVQSLATPTLVDGASPKQKLVAVGASNLKSASESWKTLWQSEPENPAYFIQYAMSYGWDNDEPSQELLDIAERIDPENGWFPAFIAASEAEKIATKGSSKGVRNPAKWTIRDSGKLAEALDLIHRAAEKPRFESYQEQMMSQRIALVKPRTDFASGMRLYAYSFSFPSPQVQLRKIPDILSAGSHECAASGNAAGYLRIVSDWSILTKRLAQNGTNLTDLLIAKAAYNSPSANFRDAAMKLGLKTEAERFASINDTFTEAYESKKRGNRVRHSPDPFVSHGSLMAGLSLPVVSSQVKSPPPVTEADLKPGRLADHALFERACSIAAWILLGLAAGLAGLHRFRHGTLNHRLATRLSLLVAPIDWILLISGGILLPLLCYFLVTRFTPLSFRDWSLRWTVFMVPSLQVGSFVTSMLVLPVVIARWRLGKRAAFLGLQSKRMWLAAFAGICSLIAIPLVGLGHHMRSEWFLIPISLPIAFPLVWLLVGLFKAVFGYNEAAFRNEILARWILPVWITGMLVMALSTPLLYKSEQYWIQRDKLMEITAETHGVSRYEWLVTQQLRKELLEKMAQAR